jgi:hypothetical protein
MTDLPELVTRSLTDETAAEFLGRVERQAEALETALDDGDLDNHDFAVGMEMELYAVDHRGAGEGSGVRASRLARLPRSVFETGAAKELGLHNAELNTEPDVFNSEGLAAQAESIETQFERARTAAREEGLDLVLDAMWTIPPAEGSDDYLGAVEDRDGVTVAQNMRPDPRYIALDNEALRLADGTLSFSVPGVETTFPTILFESLATSIQPHLQIPDTETFPAYYNAGIRTLGPLLALSTNSPFLPPDLYTDVVDPERLVEDTHHELRIAVFEQSVNQSPNAKVRVPRDIEQTGETIDLVVADDLYAPFLREWTTDDGRETFADDHWEFAYKRSTYWRWLRAVIGGDPVAGAGDERSVRIEYRPLPTQPTVRDVVGLQVLTVGLLRGLVARGHPLADLPWDAAERSFYSAAREGLDGDLAWVTADGNRTDDTTAIFPEVFEFARAGLADAGLSEGDIDDYLAPMERRWTARTTPSAWKKARVREGLADGHGLTEALTEMQETYIEQSRETDSFADWL